MSIKLPSYKGSLVDIGNSAGFIVPAKSRSDHGVDDHKEYWIDIELREVK